MSGTTERGVADLFDDLVGRPPEPPAHRSRRRRRLWLVGLVGVAVVGVAASLGTWLVVRHAVAGYDRNIERFGDPFRSIPGKDRVRAWMLTYAPEHAPRHRSLTQGYNLRVRRATPRRGDRRARRPRR